MRRSKSGIWVSTNLRAGLAAIVPRDDQTENDMQPAEGGTKKQITDGQRHDSRGHAEEHEADSHRRNDAERKRAAADERRSIEKQPHGRELIHTAAADDGHR